METKTHNLIKPELCGRVLSLDAGQSQVALDTGKDMAVDEKGLVHGGFVFSLADYAAMVAVNDPNVVLGAAQVTFLKPVRAGETVVAHAKVTEEKDKKRDVEVTVLRAADKVFEGNFTCFVLDKHVLG